MATLLACSLVVFGGCTTTAPTDGNGNGGLHGSALSNPFTVSDLALTDTDGAAFSLAHDLDRPLTLLFFGYTHCPDVCSIIMASLAAAVNRLPEEQASQVGVVLVTTDPARDDPATLRSYLDQFDPEFVGLTGDLSEIVAAGEDFGIFIAEGEKLTGGGYEVDHSTPVIGIDDRGRGTVVWTEGTSAADFAEDIGVLLSS